MRIGAAVLTACLSVACAAPVRPPAAPSAALEEPQLGPEYVDRVMRARYGAFWSCYDWGRARNSDLTGKVEVRLEVSGDGRVTKATSDAGTTLPDPGVVGCVLSYASRLSFARPAAASPVSVVHSVDFSIPKENVTVRLPPEHIQRVVRRSYGKFRKCYETGLSRNRK